MIEVTHCRENTAYRPPRQRGPRPGGPLGAEVRIYDTTLRDGCQPAGISLSLADKLKVARLLDDFGVDYVEGGWPASNPKDAQFFEALRAEPLRRARASAFGSTRRPQTKPGDDTNLRVLLEAGTPTVAIVAKASTVQVKAVLRTTLAEHLAMVADSVAHLKARAARSSSTPSTTSTAGEPTATTRSPCWTRRPAPARTASSSAIRTAPPCPTRSASANVSSGITGRVEPAHYDLRGIQADFGRQDGIALIGQRAEARVRATYPRHLPMSTSIVAFHKLGLDEDGEPAIVLERNGSLDVEPIREIVARHGFGLVLDAGARERLPMRDDATLA